MPGQAELSYPCGLGPVKGRWLLHHTGLGALSSPWQVAREPGEARVHVTCRQEGAPAVVFMYQVLSGNIHWKPTFFWPLLPETCATPSPAQGYRFVPATGK